MSVEFTFVTFTLLSVVFAAIEFDRMLLVCTTLANSTRAGLRHDIVHSVDLSGGGIVKNDANVTPVVKPFASAGLLNAANVTVTVLYKYDRFFSLLPISVNLGSTA